MFRHTSFRKALADAVTGRWGVPSVEAVQSDSPTLIKKVDEEQQVVFGEVFAPGFPDSQNHFMTRDSIRDMAYGFMRKSALDSIDLNHSRQKSGSYIVESFIARDDDPVFIPGSWVLGVHVPDSGTWSLIKSGELNGFSMDGIGILTASTLELEMPDSVIGETIEAENHKHKFVVRFDKTGKFIGGETDAGPDGVSHKILRGTLTEEAGEPPHAHRFSFVELINA